MENAMSRLIIHYPRTFRAAYDAGGYREREIMCNAHTVRVWDSSADCVEFIAEVDGETRTAVMRYDRGRVEWIN